MAYHLDDLVEVLSFSWTKGERYINVMSLILIYKLYLSLLWVYWGEGRQTEANKTWTKKLLFVDSRLKRFLETLQTEETDQRFLPCLTDNALNEENGSAHIRWIKFKSNYVTDSFFVSFYIIKITQYLVQPLMISNQIKSWCFSINSNCTCFHIS